MPYGTAWNSSARGYRRDDLSHLPVDVFTLAEIELGLNPIPFNDLFAKYDADAAITLDLTGIYIDAEAYHLMEAGPDWKLKRLRFSIAHELGHFVLHRDEILGRRFSSFPEFVHWVRSHNGKKYTFEQAANEFAGRLLVPRRKLLEKYGRSVSGVGR